MTISAEELSQLVKNRDTGEDTLKTKYRGGEGLAKELGTNLQSGLKSPVKESCQNEISNCFDTYL